MQKESRPLHISDLSKNIEIGIEYIKTKKILKK